MEVAGAVCVRVKVGCVSFDRNFSRADAWFSLAVYDTADGRGSE